MEVFLTILLVLLLYILAVAFIALIAALFVRVKGRKNCAQTFKDVFLDFFMELLNPLNWF